jgi:hypothetical protein
VEPWLRGEKPQPDSTSVCLKRAGVSIQSAVPASRTLRFVTAALRLMIASLMAV